MRIDNAEFSGSITGTEATAYLTGSFSGSFHGTLVGSIESASYATTASHALTASLLLGSVESASFATTASQLTPSNGTASVSGHLIPTDSGSHDLGSIQNPFRDLFVTTASLNFVRNGQIVSVVNAGNEYIQVGNIIIGTSSIAYASGSNGDLQNIITVNTASESNMVQLDGGDSHYTGSFTGSFVGDGSLLTNIAGGESIASLNIFTSSVQSEVDAIQTFTSSIQNEVDAIQTFTSSIQSEVDALQNQTASYALSASISGAFSLSGTGVVSGSGYVSSSINGQVITFNQADGTTETITVPAGGVGGESIASLNTFTSSIQSEVDSLQNQTASYALSASISGAFSLNGTNVVSGSGYISSSVSLNTITFHQQDGTTESVIVHTGSGGGAGGESIASLNTFTSSIQSEVDALQLVTNSYVTNISVNDNTLTVQRKDSSSFDLLVITSSGGEAESIASLNTFTSSIQSEVDALQNATGSYITNVSVNDNTLTIQRQDSSSFDLLVITSSGGGGGGESIASLNTFTSSIQSEVNALQTFTSSVQSEVDAIQGETGSYITNVSVNDNTLTIQRQDSSSYNLTVVTSSGGGGSTDTLEYNNVVRVTSGSASQNNYEMVVAGDVNKNLSWSRSSTTLTITHSSHGLSVGDVVHVRNTSVDYTSLAIQTTTTNEFTLTVANSGGTSGTEGVYVAVPRITTLDPAGGAVIFENPSAGKVQMQTVKINMLSVESAIINVDVPAGADDGFGTNDALGTRFIPLVTWYKVGDANPELTTNATITFSKTSNHDRYSIAGGNVDTFGPAICMLRF